MILLTLTTSESVSRNVSSGLKHWGIHEHVGRPLVDDIDWTTKGGCAGEASGEMWLVLDIFQHQSVSRVFGRLLLEIC